MQKKTPGNLPGWMVQVLSQEKIRKVSFSKYGRAYEMMMTRERGMGTFYNKKILQGEWIYA